jgi:putative mRNA 3-end processing factor
MKLRFLGGAREVGRSALLVDDALLVDFGLTTGNPPGFPVDHPDPEAVVVSHGHLDHAGNVPSLLSGRARPPVHWTPPTAQLADTLARDTLNLHGGSYRCPFTDTDRKRVTQVSRTHGYREPFEAAGYEVTLYDAGHIPGSAHVLIDDGDTRLLYTGDFHTDDQQLVAGTTARPAADVVVTESTYAGVDHTDRRTLEDRFAERVRTTIWEGGTVVVPAFAIGRTQEMLLLCERYDVPCYVDGMGQRVTRTLLEYPDFVRDHEALRRAAGHARFVDNPGQRERIAEQNAAIVTTSGMLTGGPAMTYVPAVRANPTNAVTLTGYQAEGTPGRRLLESGRAEFDGRVLPVSATVESFDFSAHADHAGLRSFLAPYVDAGTRTLVVHGDRCQAFAADLRADGADASAPEVGETVQV